MQGEQGKATTNFSLPAIESEASNKHQASSSKGNTLGDRAQCSGAAIVYTWSVAVAIVHPRFGSGTGISKQTAKLTCSPVAQLDRRCGRVVCAARGAGRQACGVGWDRPRYSLRACKFFSTRHFLKMCIGTPRQREIRLFCFHIILPNKTNTPCRACSRLFVCWKIRLSLYPSKSGPIHKHIVNISQIFPTAATLGCQWVTPHNRPHGGDEVVEMACAKFKLAQHAASVQCD